MSTGLNPRYTLDTYVIGEGNRKAVAAAKTAAEYPGVTRNPLFIQAASGFGKSHLLTAIGHHTLQVDSNRDVRYVTLDALAEAYDRAAQAEAEEAFRSEYGSVTTLLIDDVESIDHGRPSVQAVLEFLGELRSAAVQLVLAGDRDPREGGIPLGWLAEMDEDLIVRLGSPDVDMKLAILAQRATERESELSVEVLRLLAEADSDNVRDLLGALNRVISVQAVQGTVLSAEQVKDMISGGVAAFEEAGDLVQSQDANVDEFGNFLTGVSSLVIEQVEVWKQHVGELVRQWSDRGYNTARLERALSSGVPVETAEVVRDFETAVKRLQQLQNEMADCDPALAGHEVFHDPERVAEADLLVKDAQANFEPPPGPSEAFSMDGFLRGRSTKSAINAAKSVLGAPGARYNPLVIIGPSGVGKTHLLHAIGRGLVEAGAGFVGCVSAQSYMDELAHAVEEKRVPGWRARYRRSSAFMLDNVDMVGGDDRTQEELILLCNHLLDAERQLVFTSSHRPREIKGLDDRLVSRLEGGLLAYISAPDYELRRRVLEKQFVERLGEVDEELVSFLADQGAESVRSVLALGHRVLTTAQARGERPGVQTAQEVIGASTAREAQAMGRARPSGVLTSPSSGIENREKVVWEWPVPIQCVIEEMA